VRRFYRRKQPSPRGRRTYPLCGWGAPDRTIERGDTARRQHPFRENGVYWLTGGLGGLGRIFAEHLASICGAKIILSGRSEWTPERGAWADALRARGVAIEYLPVDIGDRGSVETAFRQIKSRYGQVTGMIHSAGVIQDAYLLKKTQEQAEAVLRPKVRGAVNLDEVTRDEPLDFVAFFSSGSGVFGNPGQADYAAANAFLDEFAVRRNALVESGGRSGITVSIGWPLWAGGGMGVDRATEAVMRQRSGAVPLPTAAGVRVFEQALQSPFAYVLVAAGDRSKLRNDSSCALSLRNRLLPLLGGKARRMARWATGCGRQLSSFSRRDCRLF